MIKDEIAEPYREKLLPVLPRHAATSLRLSHWQRAFRAVVRLNLACAKNKQWLNVWHVGLS